MSDDLPYMLSIGNLPKIFEKIKTAGTPPKFTHEFLKTSLGFSSSGDRGVIKVLRQLGFLNADSVPTSRYNEFRQSTTSGHALAMGLREGWAPIFLADQQAHTRPQSQLKETFKNVTGKAEAVAEKMASTFRALAAKADFSSTTQQTAAATPPKTEDVVTPPADTHGKSGDLDRGSLKLGVGLHNDIHIHLPATSDIGVYTAIFRAIREELLD